MGDVYQSMLGSAYQYEPDAVAAEMRSGHGPQGSSWSHDTRGLARDHVSHVSHGHHHHQDKHYRLYPGETWEGGQGKAFERHDHHKADQPQLPRGYPDYDQTMPRPGPIPYLPLMQPQGFGTPPYAYPHASPLAHHPHHHYGALGHAGHHDPFTS